MELAPDDRRAPLDRRRRPEGPRPTRRSRTRSSSGSRRSRRFAYEPLGVVGVIAPWNYPWSIPFGEVAIALMCGQRRGAQAGVAHAADRRADPARCSSVPGVPGGARAHRPRRRHGGQRARRVERGEDLLHRLGRGRARASGVGCAERLKGCVLELGGKDPALVLADANLRNAIAGIAWGGFANAGQTCSGHRARVRACARSPTSSPTGVVEAAREAARWATRSSSDTEIGPMVSTRASTSSSRELVDDAVANGRDAALRRPGRGRRPRRQDVLRADRADGVTHDMRIMREEIFGPVVPIMTVDSEEEAIAARQRLAVRPRRVGVDDATARRASGSRAGSRAGWSGSTTTCTRTARCSAPWGGVKDSGLGPRALASSASTSA